jgi:hypothetical protein
MTVKIHATGEVEGDALAAFNAGWAVAEERGYVKKAAPTAPTTEGAK